MKRFAGKVAIVTGAGGDIGTAAATRLASEGASVALWDRKLELLEDTAQAVRAFGGAVSCHGVDQMDREAVDTAVAEVAQQLGGLDVVFANAGYGQFGSFLETTEKQWSRHVDVNLTGTFHVCQATARVMAEARKGGVIVINASSGAEQHADHLIAYCATKAALRMMAIGMASELGTHRIRVNTVMPGVIETGMTAPMLADGAHREVVLAETPVGRLGRPEDVAGLVSFLASDDAGFVNGESVMVDGGQTIHGHPRWYRTDYRNAHTDDWEIGR